MADKKIFSVRVKYPAKTQTSVKNRVIQTKTEWHVKRIAIAAILLIILIMASLWGAFYQKSAPNSVKQATDIQASKAVLSASVYSDNAEKQKKKTAEAIALPLQPINTKSEEKLASTQSTPKFSVLLKATDAEQGRPTAYVKQALLTHKIERDKQIIPLPTTIKIEENKAMQLHYYTEILGMSGQSVFHQWLYMGRLVKQYKKRITNSPWRTSSSLTIDARHLGEWRVSLLNEKHQILNQLDYRIDVN